MKSIDKSSLEADKTYNKTEYKIEQLIQENEELKAKVKFYEEQFKLSQAQKFGSSSEKISEDQISFFNEAEKESAKESAEPDLEEIT